jgi:hypothetical protein
MLTSIEAQVEYLYTLEMDIGLDNATSKHIKEVDESRLKVFEENEATWRLKSITL